ncbi:hypothetical protein ACFYVL_21080 [Streptomyces sp. NPDC004111]|uniref:hypothetical protein n=1 Tax=Streptomyces sp. NPDC004111 TaxID=3364690 RepID=UPI0036AD0403
MVRRRRLLAAMVGAVPGAVLTTGTARARVPGARAAQWETLAVPGGAPAAQLRRISAAGPQLAWAVGEQARSGPSQGRALAVHRNGSGWAETDLSHLNYSGRLSDVAAGPGSAWCVGLPAGGASPLLRWDGTTWQPAAFPGSGEPDLRLHSVAVGPDGRVWVGGSRGGAARLLCGDGTTWRWLDPLPGSGASLYRVVAGAAGEVWVCGDLPTGSGWSGLAARWNGTWTVLPTIGGLRLSIGDLHVAGPGDIWAVGTEAGVGGPPGRPGSPVLRHFDGTAWTAADPGFTAGALTGIAGDAQGRAAWISGWNYHDQTRSTHLHREGAGWTAVRGPAGAAPAPYLNDVTAVPGTSEFWSVGLTSPTPAPPTTAYAERFAG